MEDVSRKPYEQLTPDNCALLLIDYQQGLMLNTQTMWLEQLKRNPLGLAGVARVYKLPTLIISGKNQDSWQGPVFPDLTAALPDAPFKERTAHNVMQVPEIVDWIEKTGRRKLIFAGITTDACITLSAIGAVGAGYEAYCVHDACATWDKVAEQGAMMRMSQRGVIMTTWQATGAELQGDWGKNLDAAKGVMEVFQKYSAAVAAAASIAPAGASD